MLKASRNETFVCGPRVVRPGCTANTGPIARSGIALLMQEWLGDRRRVYRAASAMTDGDGDRIRDRVAKGEEHAVLNEVRSGSLDLDQLADSWDLDPTW